MCRHTCPIGNATGEERNNARARMLTLSLVERGTLALAGDVVDNLYECALCGGCTNDCATGWDPVPVVKEARLEAALSGETPSYVSKLLDNYAETGNIYGVTELAPELKKAAAKHKAKTETLLYLGSDARYKLPEKALKAIALLEAAGIDFTVLEDEPDSGAAPDFLFGAAEETKAAMSKAAKTLSGYKTVVAYDAPDAKVFAREYREWGIDISADTVSFPAYIASLIEKGRLKPKKSEKKYTLQDCSLLARDLDNTESARKVLSACGEQREMLLCGKFTMLAGNLIMNEYMPLTMKKVACRRWQNAENAGALCLVTECAAEYYMLSSVKPENMELLTLEEAVLECL